MEYIIYLFLVPVVVLVIVVVGVVALFTNRNSNISSMETNQAKPKISAKDFCLNLGAFIALYTLVASLLDLLFTIIDKAYPQIISGYNYYSGSSPISWPVSILIVFFPIFILLMYFLEREYKTDPDKQNNVVHRGLTYITLFVSGLVIVGDLVTVVYYFIDGQELTTGFLLKVLVLLVVASSMFVYYISYLRNKLTAKSRIFWRALAGVIVIGSIIWAFAVLGSPRTQQLIKYDQQRVSDLQNINYQVQNYYQTKGSLPGLISDLSSSNNYYVVPVDPQTKASYEYNLIGQSAKAYSLCATFNKDSKAQNGGTIYTLYDSNSTWAHPAGHYCFTETIPVSQYKNIPAMPELTPTTNPNYKY
ncbi:hypothetical protein HY311_00095 [Candidatus Nomurabacteria bacterium]|nr:hypothetical protein [Candidatus Nomurabacteria bacterium]